MKGHCLKRYIYGPWQEFYLPYKKYYFQSCLELFTACTLWVALIRWDSNATSNDAPLSLSKSAPHLVSCHPTPSWGQLWSPSGSSSEGSQGAVAPCGRRYLGIRYRVIVSEVVRQRSVCGRVSPGGWTPLVPALFLLLKDPRPHSGAGSNVLRAVRLRPRAESWLAILFGQLLV